MTRPHLLTLTAFLLSCCVSQVIAQSFRPKTIQFKGDTEYSNTELLAAAQLKLGAVITAAEMNDHTKLLSDTGVFQDISFTFNGQDLVFQLIPAATLYPVRFENLPFPADADSQQKLHDRIPLYHGKVPVDGTLLEAVRKQLEEDLAAKGMKCTITAVPYTDPRIAKVTHMSFSITDPDIEVGNIALSGMSDAQTLKARPIIAKLTGVSYNSEGSPSQLETTIVNFYGAQGYLEAKAKATASPAQEDASSIRVPFSVSVDEGPQYKLAQVQLAPDVLLSQAAYDKLSGLHTGDVASLAKLRGSFEAIGRQYHNRGFMKAHVEAKPSFDRANSTVSYSVSVDPGPVYTMGRLRVLNVSDDIREIIVSAWRVPKGEVFNEGDVFTLATARGGNLPLERLFTTYALSYSLKLHDDVHVVDVDMSIEKKHPTAGQ